MSSQIRSEMNAERPLKSSGRLAEINNGATKDPLDDPNNLPLDERTSSDLDSAALFSRWWRFGWHGDM